LVLQDTLEDSDADWLVDHFWKEVASENANLREVVAPFWLCCATLSFPVHGPKLFGNNCFQEHMLLAARAAQSQNFTIFPKFFRR